MVFGGDYTPPAGYQEYNHISELGEYWGYDEHSSESEDILSGSSNGNFNRDSIY